MKGELNGVENEINSSTMWPRHDVYNALKRVEANDGGRGLEGNMVRLAICFNKTAPLL